VSNRVGVGVRVQMKLAKINETIEEEFGQQRGGCEK